MDRVRLNNPGHLSPDELKASFVARHVELDKLVRPFRDWSPGKVCPHTLIIGQRGMGKTTLGLMLLQTIREDHELSRVWQPVPFDEESYGIGDIADFWLTTLRHLTRETKNNEWRERGDKLLRKHDNPQRLAKHAIDCLHEFYSQTGKRPLLFVENLNEIIGQFRDAYSANMLRQAFKGNCRKILVATAIPPSPEILGNHALFKTFFPNTIELPGLTIEETFSVMDSLAERMPLNAFKKVKRIDRGRIQTIRSMTGGTPRFLTMASYLATPSPLGSACEDVERLFDEQTPYFKAQIEALSRQSRRVFDSLARAWDPLTTRQICKSLRLSTSHVSAQLKQLESYKYIESIRHKASKRKFYQLRDRFFAIYYVLRFSRENRQRLEHLARFYSDLFGPEGMRNMYRATLDAIREGIEFPNVDDSLAILVPHVAKDIDFKGRSDWWRHALKLSAERGLNAPDLIDLAPRVLGEGGHLKPEVEIALRKELEKNPSDQWRWCQLGMILAQTDRIKDANIAFESARTLSNDNAFLWNRLGMCYVGLKRHSDAIQCFETAIKVDRKSSDSWNNLGAALTAAEDFEKAVTPLRKAIGLNPKNEAPRNNLGSILMKLGRPHEAERQFNDVLEINPKNKTALDRLASLLLGSRRYSEAERVVRKIIKLEPTSSAWWNNLGICLANIGASDEAEVAYRKALKINKENLSVLINLGRLLHNLGRMEDAENTLLSAHKLAPNNADVMLHLALHYQENQRPQDTEKMFRSAINANPLSAMAWNGLAWHLFCSNGNDNLTEAEKCARRAVELAPNESHSLHTLSDILARRNLWKESIGFLARSIEIGGREWCETVSSDLTKSLIKATAAGHALEIKKILQSHELFKRFEPLWHFIRIELGEAIEPLPAEIMDAVRTVRKKIDEEKDHIA